jgi:hypothetical protein
MGLFIRMRLRASNSLDITLMFLCLLVIPRSAHAYLDPGTGSYTFQIIIAGLLGAAFAVKVFWSKIMNFLTGLFSRRHKDD